MQMDTWLGNIHTEEWLKFSRDESKRSFLFVVKKWDRNMKDIILVLGNFLLGGILNFGFKTCGLWTVGSTYYRLTLDDSIIMMLRFLSVVIISWLCRRLSVYLGDTCWSTYGWSTLMSAYYLQIIQQKYAELTDERERENKSGNILTIGKPDWKVCGCSLYFFLFLPSFLFPLPCYMLPFPTSAPLHYFCDIFYF